MDQALNPYSPGAGIRPPALVGRDRELELFDTIVKRTARGLHNRGVILHGLRGVGKTVLLNELAAKAESADWLVVQLEASADKAGAQRIRSRLARELELSARKLSVKKKWRHLMDSLPVIASFSAGLGGTGLALEVKPQVGRGDSGDIGIDLEELVMDVAASAKKDGKALAFFIDEMQDLDPELLSAIITAQHQAGQRGLPFYVFGAGLPTLPQVLAESQSYSERLFEYRVIGPLDGQAAAEALEEPARSFGDATFQDDALRVLLKASGNYPYFLQEYGRAIWNVAVASPFSVEDAHIAVAEGTEALDFGFFPSRWNRATAAEKRFLVAMSEVGLELIPVKDVAAKLAVRVGSLSNARKNLIHKGLIYAPEHGMLQFTVPGMAEYIQRNAEDA